ncbi:MAG: hypothetical protein JO317_06260, partial [Verrucomicrobiae bacterium]|nr:hypothetical protein [Verrucomicrobiae bacterium]
RCQRFDFHRIPQELIVKHLDFISKNEKIEASRKALSAVARGAEGGMRDAESALDQLIAFCGKKIEEDDVLSIFGLVSADQLRALVESILAGRTPDVIRIVNEIADQGKDLVRLLTEILETLRNVVVYQAGVTQPEQFAESPEWLADRARSIEAPRLLRIIDILAQAEVQMRYALSKKIFLEIALIKAVQSLSEVSLDEVLRKLNGLREGSPAPAAPASTSSAPATPRNPPLREKEAPRSPEPVAKAAVAPLSGEAAKFWSDLLARMDSKNKMYRAALGRGRLVGLSHTQVTIGFEPDHDVDKAALENPKTLMQILEVVKDVLGRNVDLNFVTLDGAATGSCGQASSSAPAPPESGDEAKKKFEDDPLIRKAMEVFKSQIVEVRE